MFPLSQLFSVVGLIPKSINISRLTFISRIKMSSVSSPGLTNGNGIAREQGRRGALIVFEGCDKAGKSTQCRKLVDALNKNGHPSRLQCFPDRTTETGKMIDQYLKCTKTLPDEAIHLLFSANRWELAPVIIESLRKGETVVVDRYAFSGVAFTAAKGTLDLQWCKSPDVGLPQPDQVFYLNISEEAASARGDYGQERYEKREFQEKVKNVFFKIRDPSYWKVIDAARSVEEVQEELYRLSLEVIENSGNQPILPLWRIPSSM